MTRRDDQPIETATMMPTTSPDHPLAVCVLRLPPDLLALPLGTRQLTLALLAS